MLKGKPVFLWNLLDLKRVRWEVPDGLTPGNHTLEFHYKFDGLGVATMAFNNMSGIGRGGTGVLKVDGKEVARNSMERSIPLILQWDENFDSVPTPVPRVRTTMRSRSASPASSISSRSRSTGRSDLRKTSNS